MAPIDIGHPRASPARRSHPGIERLHLLQGQEGLGEMKHSLNAVGMAAVDASDVRIQAADCHRSPSPKSGQRPRGR
jgi:hypothetical protein